MARLRKRHSQLSALQIRQAAVATRQRFALDASVTVELGGQAISAQAERLLIEPSTFKLPGLGQIPMAPSGVDLAELAQLQANLGDEQRGLLQRLGLAGLTEAEARDKAHGQRLTDADAADKACQLLALQGLDGRRPSWMRRCRARPKPAPSRRSCPQRLSCRPHPASPSSRCRHCTRPGTSKRQPGRQPTPLTAGRRRFAWTGGRAVARRCRTRPGAAVSYRTAAPGADAAIAGAAAAAS